ncbi:actin interacting protein 3 [Phlyctema vagabunda]|uniref:Actin interacting protein 3 n=1 Tax=Phlyctema vagabunda TaxID=108571 RepID=A0ABR4PSC9_9HELO
MQAQRSIQRRSPIADPGPPPSAPPRSMSPSGPQPRASSASNKSVQGGRSIRPQNTVQASQNGTASPAPPLSQIEKSVTHLLVATKQLLETLTQWSRHQATDAQVSDVYVRLGYEFNIACRAFNAINVDTSDLGNVPELLRHILESTLSQEASVESLEKYLPRIRDIIINLLHGLKRKQQKLRQKQSRDQNGEPVPRTSSVSSVGSANTGLTTLLDQGLADNFRGGSSRDQDAPNDNGLPPRMSSASNRHAPGREHSRASFSSSEQSSLSSTTMQNMPVVPPYSGSESTTLSGSGTASGPGPAANGSDLDVESFPPPPPPPKTQNALAALQRGGELERRASRRYSAYQISKHLGASPNGVPMLPPAQNSPIPNRGRNDARESMRAVQNRGHERHTRQNSSNRVPVDIPTARVPGVITEELGTPPKIQPPPKDIIPDDSPTMKTPEDKLRQPFSNPETPPAVLKGPLADPSPPPSSVLPEPPKPQVPVTSQTQPQVSAARDAPFIPEQSPQPGKELTLFLQYKTKVKKFVLTDGYNDLTIARLQLAFIEKFAWSTHHNGVDLPEIYIQDPISGVRHELEDLADIKDRSVLVLNVEVLDEVKRHIDEGLGGLKRIVEGVRTAVDDQQATIQRVSDRQQDAAKEMARLAAAPPPVTTAAPYVDSRPNGVLGSPSKVNSQAQLSEIQSLKRDLAVLRQTYSGFQADIQSSMSVIRTKAGSVKNAAIKAAVPDIQGDSGRSYVNAGKKSLNDDSDKLVGQVDDLQDIVEDLRKDVVLRGVRPLPRQLETVAKDIAQATLELKKMEDYLKREQPIWKKIWEKELETVCNDREEMTMQEDLAADLKDDLEKAAQTFALVEQATKEQMKDAPGGASSSNAARALSRGLNHVVAADPSVAKEGVLGEVRALQPNHENRLEAIERAEKLRQKELASRRGGNELQQEVVKFVEEGKLKKSGGFEEVERARKAKDEQIRREVWERQNGMIVDDEGGEEGEEEEEEEEEGEEGEEIDAEAEAEAKEEGGPDPTAEEPTTTAEVAKDI